MDPQTLPPLSTPLRVMGLGNTISVRKTFCLAPWRGPRGCVTSQSCKQNLEPPLEYIREARVMASSDSDSSFTNDESNYEMENFYDSGSETEDDDVGEEQEVRGWMYEPQRRVETQEGSSPATETDQRENGQVALRQGNTDWYVFPKHILILFISC